MDFRTWREKYLEPCQHFVDLRDCDRCCELAFAAAKNTDAKPVSATAFAPTLHGKVKFWYDDSRKYGFITADGGTDYFAHISDLRFEDKRLSEGQEVWFEVGPGAKGRVKALNIRGAL